MKIPLNEISTAGLFKLLRDVSAELEARMSAPVYHRVRDVLPLKTLRVPAEDDADFVLMIAARVKTGGYVKAGERAANAVLDSEMVSWIRDSHQSSLKLAPILGIASSTIRAVRIGQNWSHL